MWTPPGYERDSAPPGGWPVLYVNDAQNKFECWLAHQVGIKQGPYTAHDLLRFVTPLEMTSPPVNQ